jgi:uncharacterized membrane protein
MGRLPLPNLRKRQLSLRVHCRHCAQNAREWLSPGTGGHTQRVDKGSNKALLAATERLEHARTLDGSIRLIAPVVRAAIREGHLSALLSGRWLGHALHPLLTDVPMGAWTSSLILDFAGGPSAESSADLLVGVGVAAVAPTALSGWSDWSETLTPEQRRVGLVHAAANLTTASMFSASLLRRRQGRRGIAKLLSVAGAGALSVGGYLGGHLSHARCVGTGER